VANFYHGCVNEETVVELFELMHDLVIDSVVYRRLFCLVEVICIIINMEHQNINCINSSVDHNCSSHCIQ